MGEVKVQWGKLTKDDLEMIDGNYDRMIGTLQKRYGYAQERAEREAKAFFDRFGG